MLRRSVGIAVIAAWWLALLAVFCELPLRAPLRPAQRMTLPGSAFDEKLGRSHSLDDEVSIDAPGRDHGALQVRSGEHIRAEDWRILHYRVSHLPRSMELTFVFRRADSPDDVKAVSLPWPIDGSGSFDLGREPQWHGDIVEIGFSEFPTAQLAPPERAFEPFSLDRVELQSASWQGALAVKASDWFGYWPWALMSISALGPDAAAQRGRSLVLMLTLGSAGTLLALYAVSGWRGRRLMLACLGGAFALWLALDLRWLANLASRHAGTRQVYAGHDWDERVAMVPDSKLYAAAQRVHALLDQAPRNTKVFVAAGSDYVRARLVYHLLPLNTGPVNVTGLGTPAQHAGAYIVHYGDEGEIGMDLRYDAERHGIVDTANRFYPVETVLEEGDLHVYRFAPEGAP